MSVDQRTWPRMALVSNWKVPFAFGKLAIVGTLAVHGVLSGTQLAQAQPLGDAPALIANQPPAAPNQQMSAPQWSGLQEAIVAARGQLSQDRLPKPAEARDRLVAQMQDFENYLGGTTSPVAQSWFKFLSWNVLLAELLKTEPDLRALTDVEMRYRQNVPGLEYAPFQQMRQAIGDFVNAQRFGTDGNATIKALDAQLEKLLELASGQAQATELQQARDFGLVAGYLTSSNQAPELVAQLRSGYAQPNLRFTASENMLNRAIGRSVQQPTPVDECILGTRVLGNSILCGNLVAQLVPQQNGISLYISLGANFSSTNIGYNRGVKIYTTGSSPVQAYKLITLTPNGTLTQPAVASTNLQTQINGIDHKLKLVRRIASRKADEQKAEANAIGQYRLQTRLRDQFDAQVEEQLAGSSGGLGMLTQDRVELQRLGLTKPQWDIHSTDDQVYAAVTEAGNGQFAAPAAPAAIGSGGDIIAEIHQSLPINVAATVLGGRTIHSWEMDDFVRQFNGNVPPELQAESEGEPWSLTFADHHPVEVEFANGLASVSLRISKMTRGDQDLSQPASITAKYRAVIDNGMLFFERQGEVELDFKRAPSGIRAVTLRSFLKGKFDKFFRERSEPQRVVLGERLPNMPPLTLTDVIFNNGWAQVVLR